MTTRLSALLLRSSSAKPATGRHFGSSPTSLKQTKVKDPLRSPSTRKFVESLRRNDHDTNYLSDRYGQASRAFSPKLGKPFANLDQWPPPAYYRGKGHKKPAMALTSLMQKPRLREVSREEEVEPGWTRVLPPDEGRPLAEKMRAKGFKKVKHWAGGKSGGVPGWILRKEEARMEAEARGEVYVEAPKPEYTRQTAPPPRERLRAPVKPSRVLKSLAAEASRSAAVHQRATVDRDVRVSATPSVSRKPVSELEQLLGEIDDDQASGRWEDDDDDDGGRPARRPRQSSQRERR
jgi:hypothetical protein